jgi:hypothetical protein
LSFAHDLSPRRIPMILDSRSAAGSAILGIVVVRRRLGMKGSYPLLIDRRPSSRI